MSIGKEGYPTVLHKGPGGVLVSTVEIDLSKTNKGGATAESVDINVDTLRRDVKRNRQRYSNTSGLPKRSHRR